MMASKYAYVIKGLPRMEAHDATYQERVNGMKATLLADGLEQVPSELAALYATLRAEKDAAEDVLSAINLRLEAVSQMLVDGFEAAGIAKLDLAPIAALGMARPSVSVQMEPYAQVADREAFRVWCLDNGFERQMALPWQTTNALTKERLLAGEPEPDGVTATARAKVVFRKG